MSTILQGIGRPRAGRGLAATAFWAAAWSSGAALAAPAPQAAPGLTRYQVVELPALSSFPVSSQPRAIDAAGNVSGSSADSQLTQRAVLWPSGGGAPLLLDSGAQLYPSDAPGMSPNGTVAGWTNPGGTLMATAWRGPASRTFAPMFGHSASRAYDVNDAGLVVGASVDIIGDLYPVRWSGGQLEPLLGLQGLAVAVNGAGQIAGWRYVGTSAPAFLWEGNSVQVLPHLGTGWAWVGGINEAGDIAGTALSAATSKLHAVLWAAPQHALTELGLFEGTFPTEAHGLNDRGQIVGSARIGIGDGDLLAVLWQQGQLYSLNDLIDPGSPWTLVSASDINDAGVIVGFGRVASHPQQTRGFKLVPMP